MRTYKIAAIPGDGIGTEVIAAGVEVLQASAKRERLCRRGRSFRLGLGALQEDRRLHAGTDGLALIKGHDAILFGSAGAPDVPDHITLWGLRLAICQPFDQYANVRPTRILPGITSPLRNVSGPELDWVIVRENSEGEYAGVGGRVASRPARGGRRPTCRCSRAPASRASCASPSSSPARARASS